MYFIREFLFYILPTPKILLFPLEIQLFCCKVLGVMGQLNSCFNITNVDNAKFKNNKKRERQNQKPPPLTQFREESTKPMQNGSHSFKYLKPYYNEKPKNCTFCSMNFSHSVSRLEEETQKRGKFFASVSSFYFYYGW